MGFMAGFGKGFAKSFESEQARRAVASRDAFKVAYDAYTEKKTQYDTDKKADTDAIQTAKDLVSGIPSIPDGAWTQAYKWLRAGMKVEDVDEKLRNTRFAPIEAPEAPDMATQMTEAGLDDAPMDIGIAEVDATAAEIPQEPPVQKPNLLGDLAERVSGVFPEAGISREERARGRVAGAAGVSEEQMAQIQAGYTPEVLNPTVKITGVVVDPLAEFGLDKGITESKYASALSRYLILKDSDDPIDQAKAARFEEILPSIQAGLNMGGGGIDVKDAGQIINYSDSIRTPIRESRTGALTLLKQGKALDDMAQQQDTVLTATGAGVSFFESAKTELNTLFNVLSDNVREGKTTEEALLQAIDTTAKTMVTEGTSKEIARATREFSAAAVRYLYAAGAAMGQTGRDLSDADIKRMQQAVLSSNDAPSFSNNLRRFARERMDVTQELIDDALRSADINNAMRDETLKEILSVELRNIEDGVDQELLDWVQGKATIVDTEQRVEGVETGPVFTIDEDDVRKSNGAIPTSAIGKKARMVEGGIEILE